jgi:hypothetical protein
MSGVSKSAAGHLDSSPQPKRLACQICQRRKIKCDRGLPCQPCVQKGQHCIPVIDQRLSRGRNGGRHKRDDTTSARLAKVESILSQLQGKAQIPGEQDPGYKSASQSPANADGSVKTTSQPQWMGTAFWGSIKEALTDLAVGPNGDSLHENLDKLEDPQADINTAVETPTPPLVDPLVAGLVPSVLLAHPPAPLPHALCEAYLANVDPVFKVLHAPSLRAHLLHGAPYLTYQPDEPVVAALDFVVYYAALTTLNEDQCLSMLQRTKTEALLQYRNMAEAALAQADYLVTTDLTTMQALVIYLVQ